MILPDNDCVICPNCAHQFKAIPVNVQNQLRKQAEVPAFIYKDLAQEGLEYQQAAAQTGIHYTERDCHKAFEWARETAEKNLQFESGWNLFILLNEMTKMHTRLAAIESGKAPQIILPK